MRSQLSVATVSHRDRYLISICLAIVTAASWAYLVHLARLPSTADDYAAAMAAMGMAIEHPWTAVDAWFTFAMWTAMSAGMMTASAAPVLMLFAATQASRDERRRLFFVLLFGLGYLSVWTGFSAMATFAQLALQRAALLSDAQTASSRSLSAAILTVAGIYQLTPVKSVCLMHCRTPLGFLMTHWREGAAGAFRMGTEHGVLCLACCWALMIVLFAVGVMNLMWVAALTAIVLIEKVTRFGVVLSRTTGIVMIASGIYLLM